MPHRGERRNKILPTKAHKRPDVRLCGRGRERPDRGRKRPARQGAKFARFRRSVYLAIILDNELDISPIAWLCIHRAEQT